MPLRFQPARGASVLLSSSSRGPTGATGSTGATGATGPAVGVQFTYSTTTTDSDPGSGAFRLNNATVASATAAYIDNLDSGGGTASTWLDTFDDSTNTAKGTLVIRGVTTQSAWAVFSVTGSVTDGTGYRKLTLTHVASGGTWTNGDTFAFNFSRAGDKGADGAGTGDFSSNTSTSVDSEIVLFSGTGGKTGKRATTTGILKAASGVLSAAVSATDYAPATSGSAILKGNGSGGFSSAAAGTDYCGATSGSSVLKASSGNTAAATAGTDFMHPGTTSLVTVGFTLTPYNIGTVSSGTTTPAGANGNYQYYTNNGAHTLAAPAADCAIDILVTNGASAGSITFSGFTVGSSTGSAYATTNTNKYVLSIRRINSVATYSWYALQ